MWSARRLNKLLELNKGTKYLEIGVWKGDTFFSVNADFKIGIDPDFHFDVQQISESNHYFIQQDSDIGFKELKKLGILFDVIFLDGLHTFEQTYRDFLNALDVLSVGGFILLDDVFPCDEFSFIPNKDLAFKLRNSDIADKSLLDFRWHGDVFKVIAMIHDYHHNLEYATFWGSGNEQSVIWKSPFATRRPRFSGIESIAGMKHYELLESNDILFQDSENSIFLKLSEIFKPMVP